MELRWAMIVLGIMFGAPMIGLALNDYHKSECKIAAIHAHMSAEDIKQVCK